MTSGTKKPRRGNDRIILHFDYDCFYAQVVENKNPALKALPLGIRQKGILATCNYEARRRGVRKLMQVTEACRECPDLVLVQGEDLTPFRDASKGLYSLLRQFVWKGRAERLGLDEVFLDVTDMVAYNIQLLKWSNPTESLFCMSREDPEKGFVYDATCFTGCVHGDASEQEKLEHPLYIQLLLASHLGNDLRRKMEDAGFTSACGISTNKTLAKLVGNLNKPRNQTTLLAFTYEDVSSFIAGHSLRKIPGIGFRIASLLESKLTRDGNEGKWSRSNNRGHAAAATIKTMLSSEEPEPETRAEGGVAGDASPAAPAAAATAITVGQILSNTTTSTPSQLQRLLGGPGIERGIGARIWALLHGQDDSPVKPARDIPVQISVEDTFAGLGTFDEVETEMRKLAASLVRRIRIDLMLSGELWLAYPKTLRLTTRPKTSLAEGKPYGWGRASRSMPLPRFVFGPHSTEAGESVGDRLASEVLMPLFREVYRPPPRASPHQDGNDERGLGISVGLLNLCVTNMVPTAAAGERFGGRGSSGRDIAKMFQAQKHALRELTAYADRAEEFGGGGDDDNHISAQFSNKEKGRASSAGKCAPSKHAATTSTQFKSLQAHIQKDNGEDADAQDEVVDSDVEWDNYGEPVGEQCALCGELIPSFAIVAHDRFHHMEGNNN